MTNPLTEVVTVEEVLPHPNADALDIISPDGSGVNWAIVARGSVKVGDKVVWLDAMNDPLVPMDRPEFAMLLPRAGNKPVYRIRAMRLRGFLSRGLVIPWTPAYGETNEEVQAALGVTKWEPPAHNGRAGGALFPGWQASGPDHLLPTLKYDVDALTRNWRGVPVGGQVVLTEKVHGANAAYGWLPHQGDMDFRARSRSMWKKRDGGGSWWAAANTMSLEEVLRPYPGLLVYGEIYGQVQDLRYGKQGVEFVAFDVWDTEATRWYSWQEVEEFCARTGIPHVPVLGRLSWPEGQGVPAEVKEAAEGSSLIPGANHIREGVVVRWDGDRSRTILKLVGNGYLTR
jgi:RNA ligase (TIGR02306 family)